MDLENQKRVKSWLKSMAENIVVILGAAEAKPQVLRRKPSQPVTRRSQVP